MVNWLNNFIIPIIMTSIIAGVFGFIVWVVARAGLKIWSREIKWMWKYSIRKKPYDVKDIKWVIDAMDGIGFYNAQKLLLVNGISQDRVNELMWIYAKTYKQLKGGNKNGQSNARDYRQTESTSTSLPTTNTGQSS